MCGLGLILQLGLLTWKEKSVKIKVTYLEGEVVKNKVTGMEGVIGTD